MCEVIDKYRYFSEFQLNAGSGGSRTPSHLIDHANCGQKTAFSNSCGRGLRAWNNPTLGAEIYLL